VTGAAEEARQPSVFGGELFEENGLLLEASTR
jgi:hypothetical protein